jgi:hypothetical protein
MNRFTEHSQVVTINKHNILKITVTITRKIKVFNFYLLSWCLITLQLLSCRLNSLTTEWILSSGKLLLLYKFARTEDPALAPRPIVNYCALPSSTCICCHGNAFVNSIVTKSVVTESTRSLLYVVIGKCLPSRCSATDILLRLHYSGFQASCHTIFLSGFVAMKPIYVYRRFVSWLPDLIRNPFITVFGLHFDPKDGGNMSLRNVGKSTSGLHGVTS